MQIKFIKGYIYPISLVASLLFISVINNYTSIIYFILNTILSSVILLLACICILGLILRNKINSFYDKPTVEYTSVLNEDERLYINFIISYHQLFTRLLPLTGMLLIKCSMLVNLNNLLIIFIIVLLLLLILSSDYFTNKIFNLYKNLLINDRLSSNINNFTVKILTKF